MIILDQYDYIIIDGHQTIYDDQYQPINGAIDLMNKYAHKMILLSNIGSKRGFELSDIVKCNFNLIPLRVITSLDLLIQYLVKKKYKCIYHYGNDLVKLHLNEIVGDVVKSLNRQNEIEALVFTSLPSNDWIQHTQNALNIIKDTKIEILLANPDRVTLDGPYKVTVGIILDGLIHSLRKMTSIDKVIEFGKPNMDREMLNIGNNKKLIVIGDNPWTDIQLSKNLKCDSALLSSGHLLANAPEPTLCIKSLKELFD